MNEIIPNLFIGDLLTDCPNCPPSWAHLCVLADKSGPECKNSRIQYVYVIDRNKETEHLHASRKKLDKIADWIDNTLSHDLKTLVHCGHGIERAPLAVTWFLYKKRGMTLEEAWQLVSQKRPQSQDRRVWLK
jgi:protein-tyrosine phosphatase